jgi:hypothetical protein
MTQPRLTAKELAFARELILLMEEAGWIVSIKKDSNGTLCYHVTHTDAELMTSNPNGWMFDDLDMVRSWVDGFQWGLHLTQGKDFIRYDVVGDHLDGKN